MAWCRAFRAFIHRAPLPWPSPAAAQRRPVRIRNDMTTSIEIRRLYDSLQPGSDGGFRLFIDRLWPRGVARESFVFDLWCKDLAPEPELRKWFGHKTENWPKFSDQYREWLRRDNQQRQIRAVLDQAGTRRIVLLYGARDPDHNHALILAQEMNRLR